MRVQPEERWVPSLCRAMAYAALACGLTPWSASFALADIDAKIAQRVAAIEETLDRLEFDANRIANPPAYQQALKALSGSICAALTASTDVDVNVFSLQASFEGEAEAEALIPGAEAMLATAFQEFEAEGGASMSLSGMVDFSGGATHRLCINPVPWAVAVWYLAQGSIPGESPFPEVVPGEVFTSENGTGGTSGQERLATFGDAGEALGGLSTDAKAFLLAVANQIFEGLDDVDAGTAVQLPWFEDRLEDLVGLAGGVGVGLSDVAGAASGFGGSIQALGDAVGDGSIGDFFDAVMGFPEQIASIIPFAPEVTWVANNPFGINSIDDLNYCEAIRDSDLSARIPYIFGALKEACEITEESLELGKQVIADGVDLVSELGNKINDALEAFQSAHAVLDTLEIHTGNAWQAVKRAKQAAFVVKDRLHDLLMEINSYFSSL